MNSMSILKDFLMEISTLRVFVTLVSLVVFFEVIRMMAKHQLSESLSVLWLFIALTILIMGMFPRLLNVFTDFLGIHYQPALLFLMAIMLLLLITFKQSVQISKAEMKLIETAITLSILKEEQKHLIEQLNKMTESEAEGRESAYEDTDNGQKQRDTKQDRETVEAGKA